MDWQGLLSGAIVLAAAGYVGLRIWRTVAGRAKAGCGTGCDTCPANNSPETPAGFVPLDQLRRPEH